MSDYTIQDASNIWLKRCRLEGLEAATLRSYESHARIHINPRIGSILLEELTAGKVREFIDDMQEYNSRAMAKKVLTSLRSLIGEAQARDWVKYNVARDVKVRKSGRHESARYFPSKSEICLLLKAAPERNRLFIHTAIFTGLRASELRGLSWDNIDFERRVILVSQRADRFNDMGAPKSRTSRREIPIAPSVYDMLEHWREHCPKGELNLVFPNGAGNIETLSNIYNRVFRPLMIDCGLVNADGKPLFSFHCLRHAAASLMIDQGWPAKKVQSILGHSTITMTYDTYGHLFEDTSKDVEMMGKLESDLLAA